jgi:DNA-binding Xre family transcriptional regulator
LKWNLRWAAVRRDIWRPTQLLAAFQEVGFNPSLSKTAALWSSKPITIRLDDLDMICAALECTVADLMEAEPVAVVQRSETQQRAAGEIESPRFEWRLDFMKGSSHGTTFPLPA